MRPLTKLLPVLAAALALAGCGSSSSAQPHGHARLESIFESEGIVHADPPLAMAVFRAFGVSRVRVYLAWSSIAPDSGSRRRPAFDASSPAAYPASGWSPFDAIVRAAAVKHISLDLTVGAPPPLWAGGPGAPAGARYAAEWRPSAADFGAFMRAVGTRYSGHYTPPGQHTPLPRVGFWSIWNEPNYGPYLAPQAIDHSTVEVSPMLYRGLLDAAWSALAATGHGPRTDTVLIGETAPRGQSGPNLPGNFAGMFPLRFVRALYCVDAGFRPLRGTAATRRGCPATAAASARFPAEHPALFRAGGFADHPYPDLLPPNVPTIGAPDAADFAGLGKLERTLDRAAAAYGRHPKLAVYNTEFGYRTDPPIQGDVPLATAARYLNQAEYLSWLDPRIASTDQYLLTDPPGNGLSAFVTGLEFANGTPKPYVFDAYRMPLYLPRTSASRGSSLQVWGCVRPVGDLPRHAAGQRVAIQFARAGTQRYRTVRTVALSDPHGYFEVPVQFPGSGIVRLAWHGLHSRPQPIRLR